MALNGAPQGTVQLRPQLPGLEEGKARCFCWLPDRQGKPFAIVVGTDGSYAEQVLLSADQAIPIPPGVPAETVAAVLLQGITAQYLVADTFPVQPGQDVVAVLPDRLRHDHRRIGGNGLEHVHAHPLGGNEAMLLHRVIRVGSDHFHAFGSKRGDDLLFHGLLGRPAGLVGREAQVTTGNKINRVSNSCHSSLMTFCPFGFHGFHFTG